MTVTANDRPAFDLPADALVVLRFSGWTRHGMSMLCSPDPKIAQRAARIIYNLYVRPRRIRNAGVDPDLLRESARQIVAIILPPCDLSFDNRLSHPA